MSCFSGKCDIYDTLVMIHADGDASKIDFTKVKIFSRDNDLIPLRIDCEKDLVPFYPYLEAYGSGSKDGQMIHISDKSFVDREEEEHLGWYMEYVKKYFRKCKRNKTEFTLDGLMAECSWIAWDKNPLYLEMFQRVKDDGLKADIKGLHDNLHDRYRELLLKEMIRVGYDEIDAYRWCYGWDRFLSKMKENMEEQVNEV